MGCFCGETEVDQSNNQCFYFQLLLRAAPVSRRWTGKYINMCRHAAWATLESRNNGCRFTFSGQFGTMVWDGTRFSAKKKTLHSCWVLASSDNYLKSSLHDLSKKWCALFWEVLLFWWQLAALFKGFWKDLGQLVVLLKTLFLILWYFVLLVEVSVIVSSYLAINPQNILLFKHDDNVIWLFFCSILLIMQLSWLSVQYRAPFSS